MESKDDESLGAKTDSPPGKEHQEALDRSVRSPGEELQETVEAMDGWAGITQKESDGCRDRGRGRKKVGKGLRALELVGLGENNIAL